MDTVTLDRRLSQPAKEFLHQPSRLLIDGKLVEAASGKTFPVYNPATGAILDAGRRSRQRRCGPCRQSRPQGL